MIISNVIGGLGNQMFQYACARAISLRSKQQFGLAIDLFDAYKLHHGYELSSIFHINTRLVSKSDLQATLGIWSAPVFRRLMAKFPAYIDHMPNIYFENSFEVSEEVKNINHPAYLHGYWQSEKYFEDFRHVLLNDFSFKQNISLDDKKIIDMMNDCASVAVHIRRGDYLKGKNKKIFNNCDIDYFERAFDHFLNLDVNTEFFIFSDDPIWVDENIQMFPKSIKVVRHNQNKESWRDMRLMSLAKNNIISNSSFSWWAAWLNSSMNKTVVAPKLWFINGTYDGDIVPSNWVRL